MARKLVLFLVVLVAAWEISTTAAGVCNLSPMDMIRCMSAVSSDSPSAPSKDCCDAVNSLSSSDFQCLCDYKKNHPEALQRYGVNPTAAAKLPATCGATNAIACA